jgi:isopentenyl diphosphate isomerase/L-lactate dehydrogenase-like FMN-dependent dehydrogenase
MSDAATPPLNGVPDEVLAAQDYEALAPRFLSAPTLAYLMGGSGHDHTLRANRRAFAAWQILSRLLRDVSAGHTRLTLAGQALAHPLLLAPVAHQRLVHPQAERALAQAAEATDSLMLASTLSSVTLEDIAAAGVRRRWFQLYLQPRRSDSLALLRRAEAAGYQAIVLTLDARAQQPSRRAVQAGFRLPDDCTPANLAGQVPHAAPPLHDGDCPVLQGLMTGAPTVADLDWLLAASRLPVWVKGVLLADDAVALRGRGVAGLVVSNHGGRTVDGVPASLQVLPAIRRAVGAGFPLLLDGGVRSGADVFKALALGANAVALGRLPVLALAVAGALGAAHALKLLREELALCMATAGCATVAEIGPHCLWPSPTHTAAAPEEAAC